MKSRCRNPGDEALRRLEVAYRGEDDPEDKDEKKQAFARALLRHGKFDEALRLYPYHEHYTLPPDLKEIMAQGLRRLMDLWAKDKEAPEWRYLQARRAFYEFLGYDVSQLHSLSATVEFVPEDVSPTAGDPPEVVLFKREEGFRDGPVLVDRVHPAQTTPAIRYVVAAMKNVEHDWVELGGFNHFRGIGVGRETWRSYGRLFATKTGFAYRHMVVGPESANDQLSTIHYLAYFLRKGFATNAAEKRRLFGIARDRKYREEQAKKRQKNPRCRNIPVRWSPPAMRWNPLDEDIKRWMEEEALQYVTHRYESWWRNREYGRELGRFTSDDLSRIYPEPSITAYEVWQALHELRPRSLDWYEDDPPPADPAYTIRSRHFDTVGVKGDKKQQTMWKGALDRLVTAGKLRRSLGLSRFGQGEVHCYEPSDAIQATYQQAFRAEHEVHKGYERRLQAILDYVKTHPKAGETPEAHVVRLRLVEEVARQNLKDNLPQLEAQLEEAKKTRPNPWARRR